MASTVSSTKPVITVNVSGSYTPSTASSINALSYASAKPSRLVTFWAATSETSGFSVTLVFWSDRTVVMTDVTSSTEPIPYS